MVGREESVKDESEVICFVGGRILAGATYIAVVALKE